MCMTRVGDIYYVIYMQSNILYMLNMTSMIGLFLKCLAGALGEYMYIHIFTSL